MGRYGLITVAALLVVALSPTMAAEPPNSARQPTRVSDLRSAMDQTAAVVDGEVTDIRYEFNNREGPWTHVILSDVRAHFGSAPTRLEIRQLGGPIDDESMLVITELPEFVKGERYLVFLRNTAWNLSPVVGRLAFRIDTSSGVEALVADGGRVVTGINADGIQLRQAPASSPLRNNATVGLPEIGQARTVSVVSPPKAADGTEGIVVSSQSLIGSGTQPISSREFIVELGRILEASEITVSGAFHDRPEGKFNWYRQETVRQPGTEEHTDPPSFNSDGPEIDRSGPSE